MQLAGLKGNLICSGFAQAAYRYALNHLEQQLLIAPNDQHDKIKQIFIWSVENLEQNELRYPHCQRDLIHTLLLPWHRQTPSLELQHLITQFLLQTIGHPGIYSKEWQDIKAPAIKLFFRWLASDALSQFFFKETMLQKFWEHYQKTQSIDAAWLIHKQDNELKQTILLIKLPNFIIAEGIEKDTWLYWHTKNPYVPKLFQAFYRTEELTRQAEKIIQDQQGFQTFARLLQQQAQLPLPTHLFGVKS